VEMDTTKKANCSQNFKANKVAGEFSSQIGNEFFYVPGSQGMGGNGLITFIRDKSASEVTIDVIGFNKKTKKYNFQLSLPSCKGPRICPPVTIIGQKYVGSTNKHCIQVDISNTGSIALDLRNSACLKPNFNYNVSNFVEFNGFTAKYEGKYDGTVIVKEDSALQGDSVDINLKGKIFDIEISVPSCSE